jgi:hypothetical protein
MEDPNTLSSSCGGNAALFLERRLPDQRNAAMRMCQFGKTVEP